MKTVQTVVHAFFRLRGASGAADVATVRAVSAQVKTRWIAANAAFVASCDNPLVRATVSGLGRCTYAGRKAATVAFVRWAFQVHLVRPDWAGWFEGAAKRDDLADCFVQLLSHIREDADGAGRACCCM
jgi:hypothetical protein